MPRAIELLECHSCEKYSRAIGLSRSCGRNISPTMIHSDEHCPSLFPEKMLSLLAEMQRIEEDARDLARETVQRCPDAAEEDERRSAEPAPGRTSGCAALPGGGRAPSN